MVRLSVREDGQSVTGIVGRMNKMIKAGVSGSQYLRAGLPAGGNKGFSRCFSLPIWQTGYCVVRKRPHPE